MTPEDVPWPVEFVRASQLVADGATDEEVREAVEAFEEAGGRV